MNLPAPVIERHGHLFIVRDDLIPGGTKRRVIGPLLEGAQEVVYASPAYGYAQVALAHAALAAGIRCTIFTAQRQHWHGRTREAITAGARVIGVPFGYLTNVQAKARRYAAETGAFLLPFGFDTPEFGARLAQVASALPVSPAEVWCVAGSGTLTRALQLAWPAASHHAIQVGRPPEIGRATLHVAPEAFERDARVRPPFPSTSNFDAKAWQFISRQASSDALFWNVAS